jgi:hypothetical protein
MANNRKALPGVRNGKLQNAWAGYEMSLSNVKEHVAR